MKKLLFIWLAVIISLPVLAQVGGTDLPNLRNVHVKGTLTIGNDYGTYSLPRAKAADGYYLKMVNGFLVFAKPRMDNVSLNDTLFFVRYGCGLAHSHWRIAHDTLFIDTCYAKTSLTKDYISRMIDSVVMASYDTTSFVEKYTDQVKQGTFEITGNLKVDGVPYRRNDTIVTWNPHTHVFSFKIDSSGGGSVTSVTGTLPILISGSAKAPVVSISQSSTNSDGYLSYPDWRTFNGKAGLTAPVFVTNISTPQVTTTSNGDLTITPNGTGKVILTDTKTVTYDGIYSNTSASAAVTIDWTRSNVQLLNLNETTTASFTAPPGPGHLCLKIVHAANTTVYAITWPSAVKWSLGTPVVPTATSGAVDISSFFYDGTYYYAMYGNDFK